MPLDVDLKTKLLLLAPGFAIIIFITIGPFIFNYYMMFFRWKLYDPIYRHPVFVGLNNFITLFTEYSLFWDAYVKTFIFTLIAVPIEFVLGMLLALSLNRKIPGDRILRGILLIPLAMAPVAAGSIWRVIFNPMNGFANYFLHLIGLPPQPWNTSRSQAMLTLVVVDVWQWTPFVGIVLLSALASLPREPMEAAMIDGASPRQIFWHVTLPLLRNILLLLLILRIIECFKTFDYIYTLTYGGPGSATTLITYRIYLDGFRRWEVGFAAAEAVLTAIIVSFIVVAFYRLMRR
ncbi:sugar ABC transporter permease [Candidatus Bathyarchaeota archaeon]|nr:MAG: sugar ABC transporter permease [Candidatus Bathyarchaeota archaeon]